MVESVGGQWILKLAVERKAVPGGAVRTELEARCKAIEAAQGRMKKKVLGAQEAIKGGVSRVIIADGRIQNPISNALAGNGTVIQ